MFCITAVKESFLHTVGKITKGSTDVASVTDLNAVRIIQIKGISIVIDTRINTICITAVTIFLFLSILSILIALL